LVTEGVQYGEEAYNFGQAGASSEFRQSIARFRNRAALPRPPRRPLTEPERATIRRLVDDSLAAAVRLEAVRWEEPVATPPERAAERIPMRNTG